MSAPLGVRSRRGRSLERIRWRARPGRGRTGLVSAHVERLRALYAAFNARRIDAVLEQMSGRVDWPNAWEGGRLRGRDAVRAYWTRQWSEIDPAVEPRAFAALDDGRVAVDVRQTVRALDGTVLVDGDVRHVYRFDGDLIARMDVEEGDDPRRAGRS